MFFGTRNVRLTDIQSFRLVYFMRAFVFCFIEQSFVAIRGLGPYDGVRRAVEIQTFVLRSFAHKSSSSWSSSIWFVEMLAFLHGKCTQGFVIGGRPSALRPSLTIRTATVFVGSFPLATTIFGMSIGVCGDHRFSHLLKSRRSLSGLPKGDVWAKNIGTL